MANRPALEVSEKNVPASSCRANAQSFCALTPNVCCRTYGRVARHVIFRNRDHPNFPGSRRWLHCAFLGKGNTMKSDRSPAAAASRKAPTGIAGFDEISGGGLPRGRTTLLVGGPGSGKTIFSLQFLVNGARYYKEPGIFVAFEETSQRIAANAQSFDWQLSQLRPKKLLFVDAQPK